MRFRLRTTIFGVVAGTLMLVTAASAALGIAGGRQAISSGEVQRQEQLAAGVAASIDTLLSSTKQSLESAAASMESSSLRPQLDEPTLLRILDEVLIRSTGVEQVFFLDASGNALLARPPDAKRANWSAAASEGFIAARSSHQAKLSLGDPGGTPYWVVPVPATANRPDPNFVLGVIGENRIKSALTGRLGPGVAASLADPKGTILIASDPSLMSASPEGADGGIRNVPGAGRRSPEMIVTSNSLAGDYGQVIVYGSMGRIVALQAALARSALLTTGAVLVGALAVAFVLAFQITRPLQALEDAAESLARGEKEAHVPERGAREIHHLSRTFNKMAADLRRRNEELEQEILARTAELALRNQELDAFAHVVSHDLKAPLRGIRLYAELADQAFDREAAADAKKNLALVKDRTSRMSTMIDASLEYARVGRIAEAQRTVDPTSIADDAVQLVSPPKGFRLRVQRAMPTVLAPPIRLQEVFQNLIGNAFKHHDRPHGTVSVSATRRGSLVEFIVEDDGPGIPPDRRRDIFTLFQARDRFRDDSTGVGLPMVRRIVETHGGTVTYEALPRRGSRFRFTWPATLVPGVSPWKGGPIPTTAPSNAETAASPGLANAPTPVSFAAEAFPGGAARNHRNGHARNGGHAQAAPLQARRVFPKLSSKRNGGKKK